MAILTKSGRTAMAKAIADQPVFMGWGKGDPNWDSPPPDESVNATGLIDPVGYRKATSVAYCVPDPDGEISIPSGRFREVNELTHHLYFRFVYDFEDGLSESIREVAIFIGTEPKSDLPPGQFYFSPEQIDNPGMLLLLEHRERILREVGVRETFEFVVTF
ncbi:MAG: hypothetical protein AAGN35_25650 [Bacteroidota bacterium]